MSASTFYYKATLFVCLLFFSAGAFAQKFAKSTQTTDRIASMDTKADSANSSLYANIKATNIGPTVMSGRVVDVEVNPAVPHHFLVAYASGGLWETQNNGASFSPLFDKEAVMTIGDFDVDWERQEIWVGTGEVNSSRSSYAGMGMYHSKDMGKSWSRKGLEDTHHIGKVIIDKNVKNRVLVAALGHLYSQNSERGVFETTDGGETWEKVLFVNDSTGVVDMIRDSKDSNIFYAASWQRSRKSWNFEEAGKGSAIYKSIDNGKTWDVITTKNTGFPVNEGTGRIGLSLSYDNDNPVIYALVDNYNRREKTSTKKTGLQKEDLRNMKNSDFMKLSEEKIQLFLDENGFPEKYTATKVRHLIEEKKFAPLDLVLYLEDSNRLLFDTNVKGAELYKSMDGGKTWKKTHEEFLDRVFNSYGYYFGLVRAAPSNPDIVYVAGVPILRSVDGGKTFENMNKENVHADHHALWINPTNPEHIINGNDGGINISYDAGQHYFKCNSPAVGQFYAINVDNADPYHVFGGLQDNGVWYGSHNYRPSVQWHQSGQYPYKSIMGGDGMQIAIDTRDNNTVYTGFQFGNYFRINLDEGDREYITPLHELGESPYRWNWQAPIALSSHNMDIVYMGCNKLMRSMDQGKSFTSISEDLTKGGRKGDVAYGTITTLCESPLKFGLIYTGSDDGKVWRTDDGGATWNDISIGLPDRELWVSRIVASEHNEDVVYVCLNGYRWDHFEPYVYQSNDRGRTWVNIANNLLMEPVNVLVESPESKHVLFLGTDHGTYIKTSEEGKWLTLANEIPNVAVHDLKIQRRENHLLVGTHGRSIYKIDLAPVSETMNIDGIKIQSEVKARSSNAWGNKNWLRTFNEPEREVYFFSKEPGLVNITVETSSGTVLKQAKVNAVSGFNFYNFDFTIDNKKEKELRKHLDLKEKISEQENGKIYLQKGEYVLKIEKNGKISTSNIIIN